MLDLLIWLRVRSWCKRGRNTATLGIVRLSFRTIKNTLEFSFLLLTLLRHSLDCLYLVNSDLIQLTWLVLEGDTISGYAVSTEFFHHFSTGFGCPPRLIVCQFCSEMVWVQSRLRHIREELAASCSLACPFLGS